MVKNDFKAFAIGKEANVLSQNEYEDLEAIDDGFHSGIARSEQLNKIWRQASTIAAVVAQFMADKSGNNVEDDGDLEKLRKTLIKALLNNSISQLDGRYLKSSSNLSDVANAASARTNLGLRGAALQDVGTASGTVAAGNDSRIVNAAQRGKNLSDLTDKAVSLSNLNGVSKTTTVNGKALSGNINVTSQDIFNTQATPIPSGVSLNDYQTPGIYFQSLNVSAQAGSNYPEALAGSLMVLKGAGVTQIYAIYNSSRIYSRSLYPGATWTAWAKEYNSLNKPTASDIGALPSSGGTLTGALSLNVDGGSVNLKPKTAGHASYLICRDADNSNLWYVGKGSANNNDAVFNNYKGGNNRIELRADGQLNILSGNLKPVTVNNEIYSASANAFRMIYGNYGAFWRQDGANLYLLLTNSGDQRGGWNNLRPFTVSLSGGTVNIGNGLTVTGTVTPTNYSNFDTRYQARNTMGKATNGWFKDTSTGMIFMWGRATGGNDDQYYTVTLPIAFPSVFASLQVYPIYGSAITSSNVLSSAGEIKSNSQFGYGLSDSAGRPVTAKGVYWYAVGY